VGEADTVTVKLADGREFRAKTMDTDPRSDVAEIKIEAQNLLMLPLGNSEALEVSG
jgi:serine protease Do